MGMDVPSVFKSISAASFWSQNCREPAHAFSSLQSKPAAGGSRETLPPASAKTGLLVGAHQLPPKHSTAAAVGKR